MVTLSLIFILVGGGVAAGIVGRRSRGWALAIVLLAIGIDVAIVVVGFLLYAFELGHA